MNNRFGPEAGRHLDIERLLRHHLMMARIRSFEENAMRALGEKLVLGALHPSIGQEAIAVGVCGNLRRTDLLLSTHRGHGHTLAKGADALAMMCELFGRTGGTSGGKGGSMHIADFSIGMLGANGVVGANIIIAAGAAHALKLKRADAIVCCFFGDGAINRGPFLEGLNWARVYDLPVLFVCEDNGFAATTRTAAMTGGAGPAARAQAIGISCVEIDGNDIVTVDETARKMVDAVRSGRGPCLLVGKTYRLTGHTAADAAAYRPAQEVDEKWKDDPIARCEALLTTSGVDTGRLKAQRDAAEDEMRRAYAVAAAAAWPDSDLAYYDVQDIGDPRQRAY